MMALEARIKKYDMKQDSNGYKVSRLQRLNFKAFETEGASLVRKVGMAKRLRAFLR